MSIRNRVTGASPMQLAANSLALAAEIARAMAAEGELQDQIDMVQRTAVIRYTPVNGFTITAASRVDQFQRWSPATPLATGTFAFPDSVDCLDGQQFLLSSSENIAAMTFIAGDGNIITGEPSAINAGTDYVFIYDATASEIIRIGGDSAASGIDFLPNGIISFDNDGTEQFVISSEENPFP